jgi:transcriptional regulator with XRE-family HTH domain
MSSRIRKLDEATRYVRLQLRELGDEARQTRLREGLTLDHVAAMVGVSRATIQRIEAGEGRRTAPETLARHCAALGLRASIKAFPIGPPLRDAPQLSLIARMRTRIEPGGWAWQYEVGMRILGDRRALDAVITRHAPPRRCGLEFFARFHDCQSQLRDVNLKQRDAGVDRLIVVVRDTNANRRALRGAAVVLREAFPLGTRRVLSALRAGRDPGANGLVLL